MLSQGKAGSKHAQALFQPVRGIGYELREAA
jgi:hypothetical protein